MGAAVAVGTGLMFAPAAQAAPFEVNSTADGVADACDATCTLRDAIVAANGTPAADSIGFAGGVGGTITLTQGQLPITAPLTIAGPGPASLTVDAVNASRIFNVTNLIAPDQAVGISGLTLTRGLAPTGAAVRSFPGVGLAPELTLENLNVTASNATDAGGAVYTDSGSLTLLTSEISGNSAGDDLGAADEGGGGIYVEDTDGDREVEVTIRDSVVTGNSSVEGGGLYVASPDGDVVIQRSTISGNQSSTSAGGLLLGYGSPGVGATIDSSTISGNSAVDAAGGLWMLALTEKLLVTDSTISGNSANDGAGISLYDSGDAPVTIANSTIASNTAVTEGGGIQVQGVDDLPAGLQPVRLSSSIIAGNSAPDGPDLGEGPLSVADFEAGFSLIGNPAGAGVIADGPAGSNRIGVDAQLGPLTDNGGPTATMLPALTSPAIDAAVAGGLTADQRGLQRTVALPNVPDAPGSDGTDMGAAELADTELTGARIKVKKKQKQRGKEVKIKVIAEAAEQVTVRAQGAVKVKRKKFVLQKVGQVTSAGRKVKVKLNPKKARSNRSILRALDRRKKATAKLTVTFTDESGNEAVERAKVRLK